MHIRTLTENDQHAMLELLTNEQIKQTYMLPDFEKKEDAIPLFNRLMNLSNDSSRFVRCIDLDDTAIGFLNDVEIKDGSIELGYVIHPEFHNKGYMTGALKLTISALFDLGYKRVVCGAFAQNKASQRVMEKAGMLRISFTEEIEYRGKTHLCVYFEKRNEEIPC